MDTRRHRGTYATGCYLILVVYKTMIDVAYLSKLYAEKLLATSDHQEAFLKAVWVAYKEGVKDGNVGLPPTDQSGEVTEGNHPNLDSQLGTQALHHQVRSEFSEVGSQTGLHEADTKEKATNEEDRGTPQLRPRDTPNAPICVRFDRATKLTRRA